MEDWWNSDGTGLFKSIRVQILYPCNAQCSWCATRRKNPLFRKLCESGVSDRIHEFYIDAIRRLRPEKVFVSGGEPLLYPGIADFLNGIQEHTSQINLFTSYQFSEGLRKKIPFERMPLDKILLCHTTIAFEPERWAEATAGFPFDLYVSNIKAITKQPNSKNGLRKRFKFILNHEYLEEEISRFQELVVPDESFEFGLKVINEQGSGINKKSINETKLFTNSRLSALDGILENSSWGSKSFKVGSVNKMAPLLEDGDVSKCPYRSEPLELRFAFFRSKRGGAVLKYRYCPYFPSDFGYRFHIERDDPEKLERNYYKGDFRKLCTKCRFLNYLPKERTAKLSI